MPSPAAISSTIRRRRSQQAPQPQPQPQSQQASISEEKDTRKKATTASAPAAPATSLARYREHFNAGSRLFWHRLCWSVAAEAFAHTWLPRLCAEASAFHVNILGASLAGLAAALSSRKAEDRSSDLDLSAVLGGGFCAILTSFPDIVSEAATHSARPMSEILALVLAALAVGPATHLLVHILAEACLPAWHPSGSSLTKGLVALWVATLSMELAADVSSNAPTDAATGTSDLWLPVALVSWHNCGLFLLGQLLVLVALLLSDFCLFFLVEALRPGEQLLCVETFASNALSLVIFLTCSWTLGPTEPGAADYAGKIIGTFCGALSAYAGFSEDIAQLLLPTEPSLSGERIKSRLPKLIVNLSSHAALLLLFCGLYRRIVLVEGRPPAVFFQSELLQFDTLAFGF